MSDAFTLNQLRVLKRIRDGVDPYDDQMTPRQEYGRQQTILALMEKGLVRRPEVSGAASAWSLTNKAHDFLRELAS